MQAQLEWKDKGGGYKFQPFENLDSFVPEGNSLSLGSNGTSSRKFTFRKKIFVAESQTNDIYYPFGTHGTKTRTVAD